MSEPEKRKSGSGSGLPVVLVDSHRHSSKQLFRSTMQEESSPESHHKRAKAPAVPSVADQLNENANDDAKICERAMSSEKHMHHSLAKNKLSVSQSKRGSSPESLAMAAIDSKPIPAPVASKEADLVTEKIVAEKTDKDESITEEIAEERTPKVANRSTVWSEDEEEAGGLPPSESRASRNFISAVRYLFCCGMPLDQVSEHDISPRANEDVG